MPPSRGVFRLLFPAGSSRSVPGRFKKFRTVAVPTSSRRFGSLQRISGPRSPPWRRRSDVVPSSTRALSIWGWSPSLPGWPSSMPGWPSVLGKEKPPSPSEAQPSPALESSSLPAASPPPSDPLPSVTEVSDVSFLTDALTAQDILGIPEGRGYLQAIGLDYGWGPTSVMQWTLECIHVYTGVGWAASIVATAIVLRLTMLYPQYRALKFGAVVNRMKGDPRTAEAVQLGQEGARLKDLEMQQRSRALYKLLQQEYGFSGKGIGWSVIQIPFGYGLFRVVNGMAHIPVPSLETAGWLWFPDLAASDPYFILPALASGLMISSFVVNSKSSAAPQLGNMKPVVYMMGCVGLVVTTFLSSAVNLMGATMGAATLVTTLCFNSTVVRRVLRLPSVSSMSSSSSSSSLTSSSGITTMAQRTAPKVKYEPPRPPSLRRRITDSIEGVRKGFTEQMTNFTGSTVTSAEDQAASNRRQKLQTAEQARRKLKEEEFNRKYKGG